VIYKKKEKGKGKKQYINLEQTEKINKNDYTNDEPENNFVIIRASK
jgi:hypothetical protein